MHCVDYHLDEVLPPPPRLCLLLPLKPICPPSQLKPPCFPSSKAINFNFNHTHSRQPRSQPQHQLLPASAPAMSPYHLLRAEPPFAAFFYHNWCSTWATCSDNGSNTHKVHISSWWVKVMQLLMISAALESVLHKPTVLQPARPCTSPCWAACINASVTASNCNCNTASSCQD